MTRRAAVAASSLALLGLLACLVPSAGAAPPPPVPPVQMDYGKAWVPEGPGQIQNGQVEGATIANLLVRGAMHTCTAHPANADIIHVGAVHGGIWRTTNATAGVPTWTNVTPIIGQQAIGAMEYDPSNANIMIAGAGYMSSFGQGGDVRVGNLFRSTNGGATWTTITNLPHPSALSPENIVSVKSRGNILIAASNTFFSGFGRMFRSTDTGATWTTISGTPGTLVGGGTFPTGAISDVVGDPNANNVLYCGMPEQFAGGAGGIYRSQDTGATWELISAAANSPRLNAATTIGGVNGTDNIEMSVSPTTSRLWVIVVANGMANYIGYSDNPLAAPVGTVAWTELDLPLTPDAGGQDGLQPRAKPGGQGATHLSILADENNDDIVYIGGDRQPANLPNSIGANDFSGRLFRGDATQAANGRGDPGNGADMVFSPQWAHLTHVAAMGFPNGGTASNSSPHADSREMVFDANGDIIEVDDGGIFRRTSPIDNTGDWFEIGGNMQVHEAHDMVYDRISDILITGNQDVGTTHQTAPGSLIWTSMSNLPNFASFRLGDGGDAAVDVTSMAGVPASIRYNSAQRMQTFGFHTVNAAGVNTAGRTNPPLMIGGNTLCSGNPPGPAGCFGAPQFKTPFELNKVPGSELRMVFGMGDDIYETMDMGTNVAALGAGGVNRPGALAYGAGGNPEALYAGSGGTVFVRMAAGLPAPTASPYPGGSANDIVMDPTNAMRAFFADANGNVYQTTDGGATAGNWSTITGNLAAAAGTLDLRTIEYVTTGGGDDSVLVGTTNGVYGTQVSMLPPNPGPIVWSLVGTGLPDGRVWEIQYDPVVDTLFVATMGHGQFSIDNLLVPTDVTPPVINCTLLRTLLYPPFRAMLPLGFTATITDNQPPPPQLNVSIYSDEPDGAAPFAPDATGTMPSDTLLRAERMFPGGNGRVYLLRLDGFDAAGNVTTICKSVVVPTIPTLFNIMAVRMEAMAAEAACIAIVAMPGVATPAPAGYTLLHCYTAP